jgi:hypothetical protein
MSQLTQLQDTIAERLAMITPFTDGQIPVISRRTGDIVGKIDEAIAALGICVIVLIKAASVSSPNLPGPHFTTVEINLIVLENPTLNITTHTALGIAERVTAALHHWVPPCGKSTISAAQDAIRLTPSSDDSGELAYTCSFIYQDGLTAAPLQ